MLSQIVILNTKTSHVTAYPRPLTSLFPELEIGMSTHVGIVFSFAFVSSGYIAVSERENVIYGSS